jgi:glycosyltransferase involved in cell wall biosynthesis
VESELELADLVLVPSRFVAGQLTAHGVPAEKLATLPYGVDLRAFHPPAAPRKREGVLECLYVGHISHRKGVSSLLEAARRCRDLPVRFRLIGPVVSREVLADLPDNAVYEGASLPGGVAHAMRQADLFVLPTLEDSFALVLFEAMATGLPVVTTTNAGASELIEDSQDGLIVAPGDAAALADAIRRLVEQPELRARLGDAACIKVQAAHSWDSYGHSVLSAIQSRLPGGASGGTVDQSAAR